MADDVQIAWLAGLLEGEGSFSTWKAKDRTYPRVTISLTMTDEDPVARAAELFGVSYHKTKHVTTGGKAIYRLTVSERRAVQWMMTILPFMSRRRRARIAECIAVWKRGGALSPTM